MREPDAVIEGQIPIWRCDGTYEGWGENRVHHECSHLAIQAEYGTTLGGGDYCHLECAEHSSRGSPINANHTAHWYERLPQSSDRSSSGE